MFKKDEEFVRNIRLKYNIRPFVKQIDTLALNFQLKQIIFIVPDNAEDDDLDFDEHGIMVLGCGAYRIGSSVEFDWSAVSCNRTLKYHGQRSIAVKL